MWSQSVLSLMNGAFQEVLNHKPKGVPGDLLDFIPLFSFGALLIATLGFLISPGGDTHLERAGNRKGWSLAWDLGED